MQESFQALGSYYGGKATKAANDSEALLAERQAQDVDLQALQTSEQRREQLHSAMATIEARRASSGAGLDSPSGDAIMAEVQRQSARAESIGRVGYGNQRAALLTSAQLKRQYGRTASFLGTVSALGDLASGGEKVAKAFMGGG
jgi:hypothetical protein